MSSRFATRIGATAAVVAIVASLCVTSECLAFTLPTSPLETKLDKLEVKADSLQTLVTAVGVRVGTVSGQVARLETKLDNLEAKTDHLGPALARRIDQLEIKLDHIEGKLDNPPPPPPDPRIEEKLDRLEAQAALIARVLSEQVLPSFGAMETKLDYAEGKADRHETKLDRLESKADQHSTDLSSLAVTTATGIETLSNILRNLEAKIERLEVKIDALSAANPAG